MKKLVLFCGFVLLSNCLFGQELFSQYPMNYYGDNAFSNYSLTVSPFADSNAAKIEDDKWIAFALNFFVGAGVGSFVQGDTLGGVVGLCGELGGFAFIVAGIIPTSEDRADGTTEFSFPNIRFVYIGFSILMGTRIFELIRPFTYAKSLSVAVAPDFDANGNPSLTAMVKFKM
ncbi:MAG: P13 family porin [Treponema sp.]|jgi:hypothetical protein|nr:P13 family porin [Treponema sp.]